MDAVAPLLGAGAAVYSLLRRLGAGREGVKVRSREGCNVW